MDGKKIINELDYRQRIKEMKPKELSQFTALQVYEASITLKNHECRLIEIENRLPSRPTKKRRLAFTGTIATAISAAIYTIGRQLGFWN